MTKPVKIPYLLSFVFAIIWVSPIVAGDIPTVLTCTVNAHVHRDYGFIEKAWMGPLPDFGKKPDSLRPFDIATKSAKSGIVFRDKVFSGLDTPSPVVRSITPPTEYVEEETAAEFNATIISRFGDTVFLMWDNDHGNANKVWIAAVDLVHRKATLSQLFRGITSVGVEAETLDCK